MTIHKTCLNCNDSFNVLEKDLDFYARVSPVINNKQYLIPPPTLCPSCRWQRRLSYRNERTLYRRKCDITGKSIISMHADDVKFPVYNIADWLSDKWDALVYGRDYDFSKPFFVQFNELADVVPHFSLFIDPQMDLNSEYTNCASENKNCYLISQAKGNENCYYSRGIGHSRDCSDCLRVSRCELCYECINSNSCYHCLFCQDCDNCSDCYFSSDLKGCKYCFGSHGLTQKEYYFFNKPLSRSDWTARFNSFVFSPDFIKEQIEESRKVSLPQPRRFARIINSEDSFGDYLFNCRDAYYCFDAIEIEHCSYCQEIADKTTFAYDYSMWGANSELIYECCGCGHSAYDVIFSAQCWQNINNIMYCQCCFPSVRNSFGCFGLKQKEYCILNKQYSKNDYEQTLAKIISHMMETKEWGEFFPIIDSPFGYNETVANDYFPLSMNDVINRQWPWRDQIESLPTSSAKPASLIPVDINHVDESICNQVFSCEVTNKPFKIIKQELELYKKLGVSIPRRSPAKRHKDRVAALNPRQLYKRRCEKCGDEVLSTFQTSKPDLVYCEKCYLETL